MKDNLPKHVALIMDGNRRWAKQRNLPAGAGHKEGAETLEEIVKAATKNGVKYLTVYALSTENLKKREKGEIEILFGLLKEGFVNKLPLLKKEGVKVRFIGEIDNLPWAVRKLLGKMEKRLSLGKRLNLSVALNYGARDEIVKAAQQIGKDATKRNFPKFLTTKDLPDPDLIIRTGGEKRLSNFLLWQAAYSELYFTNCLWPDFGEKEFLKALKNYEKRKRNFGS